MKNVAVIGGSGFIGTRLCQRLSEQDNVSFSILDIAPSAGFPQLVIPCDVTQPAQLSDALKGKDCIINLSAEHKDNVQPIQRYYDVNVQGAENVCQAARDNDIQHIIFTSSVAIYGLVEQETFEDGDINYFNHYGQSKYEAEQVYLKWLEEDKDNRTLTIIRPTVVFGEGNRGNVYNLLKQISSGNFIMIGDGTNKKSLAYVENVAAFIQHRLSFDGSLEVFNYADKPDLPVNELVTIANQALDKKPSKLRLPYALGMLGGYGFDLLAKVTGREFPISSVRVKKFCATTQFGSKYRDATGFTPPVDLPAALSKTIQNEFK
ncbi:nucleoside-diphosphate-sugar epimerase [Idiomarina aquatica]|uniref:Nucleoside-diphosphate-sugar epimerase n=1 Tax=Idiomarina aquatica TaxID=1327752 RepID=A0A4R6PNT3_9GAMM|nr:NAD-dependent epimerase/dehydratase family protein [Idiomarina aquatica]TDP40246.1 nucleoside-diphosphate-sugar epimerase [Idiomarina aquatica]